MRRLLGRCDHDDACGPASGDEVPQPHCEGISGLPLSLQVEGELVDHDDHEARTGLGGDFRSPSSSSHL